MFPSITLLGKSNRFHSEVGFGSPRGGQNCQWTKQSRSIVKKESRKYSTNGYRHGFFASLHTKVGSSSSENSQDGNKMHYRNHILRPPVNKSLCYWAWKKTNNKTVKFTCEHKWRWHLLRFSWDSCLNLSIQVSTLWPRLLVPQTKFLVGLPVFRTALFSIT